MTAKIYYVSQCPVCDQGLVRVRICVISSEMTPIFICDECDAAWSDPGLVNRLRMASEQPASDAHLCENPWGENTHWATAPEIALLGLYRNIIVAEVPIPKDPDGA